MMDEVLEKIMQDIKADLSEKRFRHSLGVMKKARELAKIYNINEMTAARVGLAHDIAKEFEAEEALKYIKNNNINADEIEMKNPGLLHGKIGADICKKRYGFTDEMCNAIANHTTGKIGMSVLDKILILADKLEDGRNWDGIDEVRKLAEQDMNKALVKIQDRTILKCINKGTQIHINSVEIRNELLETNK